MKSVGVNVKIKIGGVDFKSITDVELPKFTKVVKREITMSDLLIWAIRDERVMEWIDAEHEGVGGMKSQLGALIAQCEIGGRVDGGGGVSSDRMPYDAMRVGFAVQGLSKDMQAIVVSNARAGQGQYRPVLKTIPCDSKEAKIEVAAGEVLAGVSRKWVKKDGVRKQVRCYPYCRITSTLTTKDMRYFIPQYKLWVKAVKLCTAQLSDLEGFKLIVPVLPEFWD